MKRATRWRGRHAQAPRLRIVPPRKPFVFEELDEVTRSQMLIEFRAGQAHPNPYRSPRLTQHGLSAWEPLMEIAIQEGNELTLTESLSDPAFWIKFEPYKKGVRAVPWNAHETVAITEFGTWYVRGFTRRLLDEGVPYCQVYRAAPAGEPQLECEHLEDQVLLVKLVYDGHRARYWPEPGNPTALSIPVGFNCHHSIRRHSSN